MMMKPLTATLIGATLLASPAGAAPFIIGGPAVEKSAATPQIERAAWHGWRRGGWGWWGPGAIIGGLAAGAVAGSYAYGPGYYGYGPGYYGYGPGTYYGYGPMAVAGVTPGVICAATEKVTSALAGPGPTRDG